MEDNNKDNHINKDNNNYKGISALGHDRYLGFLQGHQGNHFPCCCPPPGRHRHHHHEVDALDVLGFLLKIPCQYLV